MVDHPTPSDRGGRRFAAVMVSAACMAIVSHGACMGKRGVNPGERQTKVDANRQPFTLEQLSHLDQKTFEQSLWALRQAMEQPSSIPVADHETLPSIAGKLRQTSESTPEYWPAVLRFLQFASSRMAKKAPSPGQPPKVLSDILYVGIMRGIREEGKTILFDGGTFGNSEFTNCRIIFTANPVQMQNVRFTNCVFEFPPTDPPSPYIRKVSHTLLSSDLHSILIASL